MGSSGSINYRLGVYLTIFVLLFVSGCSSPEEQNSTVDGATPDDLVTQESEIPQSTPTALEATLSVDPFLDARLRMVENTIVARGVSDPDVLRAMRTVPRQEFVHQELVSMAYNDNPLPIGYGQTISQPYIVAWMTELLELKPGEKVLEIGTGSAYQAAILAEIGGLDVYSIEIVPELAGSARERLDRLGYGEVITRQGDGYYGWEEYGPFDAIIITAAPDHLPPPLVEQLKQNGRLVVPIGPPGSWQTMWKFVKQGEEVKGFNLGLAIFVPLTGEGH